MKGKLYNLSQIKLFLGEDRKQLGNMITIFLNETPIMLKALNDNLSNKNYAEVRFYAHKLKSSIDLFQINGLQLDIRKLETLALEQNDIPSIGQYVSEVTNTLENVMQEISKETLKSA